MCLVLICVPPLVLWKPIPAWEVSPEELRWDAHQEMKETGACVKYQIQMRLMLKNAQTHIMKVIRDILGPEVFTTAVDLHHW